MDSSQHILGENLIPLLSKIQNCVSELRNSSISVELLHIAVVGSHGSGKSNVVEALVGREFLPKIRSRRPLLIQLSQTRESEYAEFSHAPGKLFYKFEDVGKEIQEETEREAGINNGISDREIRLKIFSPHVLNMSILDLPGIAKIPVGDQPRDIEQRIRTMIFSYITSPNYIILAVTPANSDLANSDAIQVAATADPQGIRTIGVMTKLDIMDRGTDARQILLGKVIPLQLGYVGVVSRSQEDYMLNRTMKDAFVAEEKFFLDHPVYSEVADQCGVPQLIKKLNKILLDHIKTVVLPYLKGRVNAELVFVAQEIAELRDATRFSLSSMLKNYAKAFILKMNEATSSSELAVIRQIFELTFAQTLMEVDPFEGLTDNDIQTALENAGGTASAVFMPEAPFEMFVKREVERFLDPSLQCARLVHKELTKMGELCMVDGLERFPVLRNQMGDLIRRFLQKNLQVTEMKIGQLVEMEKYINMSHRDFIGGKRALENAMAQINSRQVTIPTLTETPTLVAGTPALYARSVARIVLQDDQAQIPSSGGEVQRSDDSIILKEPSQVLRVLDTRSEEDILENLVVRSLIESYYNIMRKNLVDIVPKAVMLFLVNETKKHLDACLEDLDTNEMCATMLEESDEFANKIEHLGDFQQSLNSLDEVRSEAEKY